MAVDGGKLRISTEIDLKGFYKDLKELDRVAPTEINIDFSKIDTGVLYQKIMETFESVNRYFEKDKIELLSEDDEIRAQRLVAVIEKMQQEFKGRTGKTIRLFENNQLEEDKQDLEEINEKIGEINTKTSSLSNLDTIGNSIKGITSKVIKWGLAVFGIRNAYSFLTSSMSTIAQYDDQLAADITYIKSALALTVEPIVRVIINLVKQLMYYVSAIIQSLTGKNIFANANKSLEKSNKQAKKLQNTLASFDEMNVLNDSSSGGGGATMPSFDLTQNPLANLDLNSLIEKGKEMAVKLAEGINSFFATFDFIGLAQGISTSLRGLIQIITTFISTIDWKLVGQKIAEFILHFDWLGLLVDIVKLFIAGKSAIYDLLGGLINGIISSIVDIFSSPESASQFFETGAELLASLFEAFITAPLKVFEIIGNIIKAFNDPENQDKFVEVGQNILLGLANGILSFVHKIGEVIGKIIDKVKEIFGINSPSKVFEEFGIDLIKGLINGIQSLIQSVVNVFSTIWEKIKVVFSVVGTWFKDRFKEAWNNIKSVFSSVGSFFGGIWNTIKSKFTDIGSKVGETVGGAFKNVVNGVLGTIESVLNTPIKSINNLLDIINAVLPKNIKKLPTFSLPRLAKGGIINMPNKGVMVGSAVAGESGREGVLPLTDSQAMEQLGATIGRYITINANITNTMNGRVISRELQKINNENDFAFNR